MDAWRRALKVDPIPALLRCGDPAVRHLVRRDLLDERVDRRELWDSREAQRILRRQRADGGWSYPAGGKTAIGRSARGYDLVETYRMLGFLVEKLDVCGHEAIDRAREFVLSAQTKEGDIRGIYGNQTSPNYTAGFLELLLKGGSGRDPRIERAFDWLLAMRQDDGGWAIPMRTRRMSYSRATLQARAVAPDTARPSSSLVTGIVLRAFAAHARRRRALAARRPAAWLASRLMLPDVYPDRRGAEYWTRVAFPFWFNDVVSTLDTLAKLGVRKDEPHVADALAAIRAAQRRDGLFAFKVLRDGDPVARELVSFAACRALKAFS